MLKQKKRPGLAAAAAAVGKTAVAGYGLSMGHDLWKATKKGKERLSIIFIILGSLALPALGGRELVRGHGRTLWGTLFKTLIGSILLAAAGFALAWLFFFGLVGIFTAGGLKDPWSLINGAAACVTVPMFGIGLLWGAFQRPTRLKMINIERSNDRFLESQGFKATNSDDITHFDPADEPLRFLEAHDDRLVFMAVGRRGKRAYINLDGNGRMISYSGLI